MWLKFCCGGLNEFALVRQPQINCVRLGGRTTASRKRGMPTLKAEWYDGGTTVGYTRMDVDMCACLALFSRPWVCAMQCCSAPDFLGCCHGRAASFEAPNTASQTAIIGSERSMLELLGSWPEQSSNCVGVSRSGSFQVVSRGRKAPSDDMSWKTVSTLMAPRVAHLLSVCCKSARTDQDDRSFGASRITVSSRFLGHSCDP
jgi:hypothetical protein